MLFPLLAAALTAPIPTQLSFPVGGSQSSHDLPGVERRMDEHGREARAFVDSAERVQLESLGGQQALGSGNWLPLGPFGGDVEAIAVSLSSPSTVVAGLAPTTGGGALVRSTDGGATWSEVGIFAGTEVYALAAGPNSTFYAGTIDGVSRSTDNGLTWSNLPLGIGVNDQVLEIAIDPNNSATIWVGVADALGAQTNTLLKSTDGGATWVSRTPPGGPYSFTGIAIDPNDSNRIFAAWRGAFGGGGVFFSFSGGSFWADRSGGLPDNPMNDVLYDGARLLLCGGQLFGNQSVGVYISHTDGLAWTQLSSGAWPNRAITDLEVDTSNASRILCSSQGSGIFESTDGGVNWSFGIGGTGSLSANCVLLSDFDSSEVFVGAASSGVWKSYDGGASFAPFSVGIAEFDVYSVASNPTNPSELAIAFQGLNNGGVQTSTDGGVTWTVAALPGTRFNTVGFDDNGTLYAISDGPTTIGAEGLYRRTGGSWTSIGPDQGTLFESELFALTFDPTDPTGNTIFSGGSDFGVAGAEPTIWRTSDGGTNWAKVYEGPVANEDVSSIAFPLVGSGIVVASYTDYSATQSGGALRSTDNGQTWADSSSGLPAGCQGADLSLSADGTTLLIADIDAGVGNGGLQRSTDTGQTWSLAGVAEATWYVAHDPNSANEVLTTHGAAPRVRISTDGGATQSPYDTGIPAVALTRDLYVAPDGSASYLATNKGLYRNSNGLGTSYCGTSPNSVGNGALISASGSTSVAANDLVLFASGLPVNKPGLFFYGAAQATVPLGNGVRCVSAGGVGLFRHAVVFSSAGGAATFAVDYTAQTQQAGIIVPGSTWNFQFWYRDPVDPPAGFNLSDALQLVFGA